MKDISKRFINVHGNYSPIQTIRQNMVGSSVSPVQFCSSGSSPPAPTYLPPDYSQYAYKSMLESPLNVSVSHQEGIPDQQGHNTMLSLQLQYLHQQQQQHHQQGGGYQLLAIQPPSVGQQTFNNSHLQTQGNQLLQYTSTIQQDKAALTSPTINQLIPGQSEAVVTSLPVNQLISGQSEAIVTSPSVMSPYVSQMISGQSEPLLPLTVLPNPGGRYPTIDLNQLLRLAPHLQAALLQPNQAATLMTVEPRTSPLSKPRSPLLEAFRNNRCPILTLNDIKDHALEFSKDQHGSRFIQQKLEHSSPQLIQNFWKEVEGDILELMIDVFGNYVVQKLIDFGATSIKQNIVDRVLKEVMSLSLHQFGCRVIQKVIAISPKTTVYTIAKEMENNILNFAVDQHANHVIQKLVLKVDSTILQTFINPCVGKVVEISCNEYGCRVMQRFLENSSPDQRKQILSEVDPNIFLLVQEQYGNYIIQHVLDHGDPEEIEKVVQSIEGHFVSLAQHKYASNVLEKCIEKTKNVHRSLFVAELVTSDHVGSMIEGQYSNYVLQKMMDTAPPEVMPALMEVLRLHKCSMERHSYGKNIWARLEKYFTQTTSNKINCRS